MTEKKGFPSPGALRFNEQRPKVVLSRPASRCMLIAFGSAKSRPATLSTQRLLRLCLCGVSQKYACNAPRRNDRHVEMGVRQ